MKKIAQPHEAVRAILRMDLIKQRLEARHAARMEQHRKDMKQAGKP